MKLIRRSCLPGCLLLVLASVSPLHAQPAPQPSLHTMWKAEGKTNGTAIYLLGSVHVLKAEDYPLPDIMENAFTNSPVLVFEADMAEMEDPKVQMKIMSKAQLPAGETLAQQLSPPVYAMFTN